MAANCVLFMAVAAVSLFAHLAVQLARVAQDLWTAVRKRFSGPGLDG